jgi:hypothetical protein
MAYMHVGDYGTIIRRTIYDKKTILNLANVMEVLFRFRKPDGTTFDKVGSVNGLPANGQVQTVMQEGEIDQDGAWNFQVIVTFPASKFHSDVGTFLVKDNIPLTV